jgi:hypothetical protein
MLGVACRHLADYSRTVVRCVTEECGETLRASLIDDELVSESMKAHPRVRAYGSSNGLPELSCDCQVIRMRLGRCRLAGRTASISPCSARTDHP